MKRVWFPDFYTEAHRTREKGEKLAKLMRPHGVDAIDELDGPVDGIFCGSIFTFPKVQTAKRRGLAAPVVHYNWDVYPSVIADNPRRWMPYLMELQTCAGMLVPTSVVVKRTMEHVQIKRWSVVAPPVHPWDAEASDCGYILNVMRRYTDQGFGMLERVCRERGFQYRQLDAHNLSDEQFHATVAGASVLVSPSYDASTGGLTLLEGYRLGKPVLVSDSPYNGAKELFGSRCATYRWNSESDLAEKLKAPLPAAPDAKQWVESRFSDERFAMEVCRELLQWM